MIFFNLLVCFGFICEHLKSEKKTHPPGGFHEEPLYTVSPVRWDTYFLANRVENQKLNQLLWFGWVFGFQLDSLGAIRILRHTHSGALLIIIVNGELDLWQTQTSDTSNNLHHASVGGMKLNLSSCLPIHGELPLCLPIHGVDYNQCQCVEKAEFSIYYVD